MDAEGKAAFMCLFLVIAAVALAYVAISTNLLFLLAGEIPLVIGIFALYEPYAGGNTQKRGKEE